MNNYEIVLIMKIKRYTQAENVSNALQKVMSEVAEEAELFTPTTWSVKEKAEE
jgi:hypothetical protein